MPRNAMLLALCLLLAGHAAAQTCDAWFHLSVSSGSLPNGVTLNSETGALTGTPTAYGLFTFTVQGTTPCAISTRQYTIAVPPPAPGGFSATATGHTSVALNWNSVAGSPSYEIERYTLYNGAPVLLGPVSATSFVDNGVVANNTYLYRVRATVNGASSPFSTIDPATTVLYTDPSLTTGTFVKAVHFTDLRRAIDAMRVAAGLLPGTYPGLGPGEIINVEDLTSLRSHIDAARTVFGLPPLSYTDSLALITATIKAIHINEIRAGAQ